MNKVLVTVSALALAGCATNPPGADTSEVEIVELSDTQFSTVKSAVRQNMKDPDSAQFGRYVAFRTTDSEGEQTDYVCGYVNGKNSFGGYVGMTPYIALGADGTFISAVGPNEFAMQACQRNYGVSI